jgi:hypothetical protein
MQIPIKDISADDMAEFKIGERKWQKMPICSLQIQQTNKNLLLNSEIHSKYAFWENNPMRTELL